MSSDKLVFWGNVGCPYVQRAWLVLEEKQIPYEWKDIALQDENGVPLLERKKDIYPELYQLNPHGKVPVLQHKGGVLYESLVVAEYLDEVFPQEPKLVPADPIQRGIARIWISNLGDISFFPLLTQQDEQAQEPLRKALTAKLTWLNSEMEKLSKDGPYFLGKDYSIVDISFIPLFDRLVILLKHYRNYEVPKELTRLLSWYNAVKERPAYKKTVQPDWEQYLVKVGRYYATKK